jgi:MarR family transcriptional regulator, organic hydroperoxide resistance regulator
MGRRRVNARLHRATEPSTAPPASSTPPPVGRTDLGFLLAQASRQWNALLANEFRERGYAEVRPAFGSVLVPLFEENGLRIGELAERSHLAKQTMTTMVRAVERAGLVDCQPDPGDARATQVHLTQRGHALRPVAFRTVTQLEQLVETRLGERRTAALRASLSQIAELAP